MYVENRVRKVQVCDCVAQWIILLFGAELGQMRRCEYVRDAPDYCLFESLIARMLTSEEFIAVRNSCEYVCN